MQSFSVSSIEPSLANTALWPQVDEHSISDRRNVDLFLRRCRAVRYPVLCRRQIGQPCVSQAFRTPRFQTHDCHLLSAERRWLMDHLFSEEMRATFEEASQLTRRMVAMANYRQGQAVAWGANLPYSVGIRRDGCMEFCSWGSAWKP